MIQCDTCAAGYQKRDRYCVEATVVTCKAGEMRRIDETTQKPVCVSCSDETRGGIKGCTQCLFGNPSTCQECATGFFRVQQSSSNNVYCVEMIKCEVGSAPRFTWDNINPKSFSQTCVKCADSVKGCLECFTWHVVYYSDNGYPFCS